MSKPIWVHMNNMSYGVCNILSADPPNPTTITPDLPTPDMSPHLTHINLSKGS